MDLVIAIERCCPGAEYRLSKSIPPHEILEWRDTRVQPTKSELDTSWASYIEECRLDEISKSTEETNIRNVGRKFRALLNGELVTIEMLEKV